MTLALCGLLAAQVILAALDLAFPPDLTRAERSSPVALDRRGAWLRALPAEDGRWRIRADLGRTDPTFVRRLIAAEDARYRWHPGVDPLALARALATNAVRGRTVSGGSTLSMQTARLLSGEHNLVTAAKKVMELGPKSLVIKHGEYGATAFFSDRSFTDEQGTPKPFRAPALPIETGYRLASR